MASTCIGLATSVFGPSRHIALPHEFGRYRGKADVAVHPHRLFVATNTEKIEQKFKDWPPKELALEINSQVAKQAVKYVYGIDHSELGFVDKLISSDCPPRLMEMLRDRRRQRHAPALKSP